MPPPQPSSRLATIRSSKAGWSIAGRSLRVTVPLTKKWFIGDFRKAFAYMENWPIPLDSKTQFRQDIVVRFKASERGAVAVINPCYGVESRTENACFQSTITKR
jgi:hypothetical protein